MRAYHALTPLPPHVIDQIRRQERDRQRDEESRRLPLELPQTPPPGWKRDQSGEWVYDDGDRQDRDNDGCGVVIQMC